jgi:hypothetical protein
VIPQRYPRSRTVKKPDLKAIERLAKKNREKSQAQHSAEAEAEAGKDAGPKKKGRRDARDGEPPKQDPRYEGADRLHTEMKRRDRP